MSRSPRSPASTAALALLGLLAVVPALWRGGVDWPAQAAAVAVASVAALLASGARNGSTPLLAAALGLATGVTLLQLLPVPAALHRALSPGAADLFDTALGPLGLYPSARPFSLDPPETARELAKAVACLLVVVATAQVASTVRRRDRLLAAIALGGVAASAAGLFAAVAGMGPLLEPRLTFVNPNHLAGFLNLTGFVALGFALRSHGRARLLWLLAFAVAGSGVFLSLSRGGIAAFFVGVAVFGVLYVRRARLDANEVRYWRYAALPAAVSVALAVVAYLALDAVLAEMRTVKGAASEVKLSLWPIALAMLRRFPLTGIGRGAFATAFAGYKVEPDPVTFTHLENEWLQAPVDLGIPVGLLLVATIAWTWLRAARARDLSRPEMGALAGAAALGAQTLVDFSLELLGVALPFAVVLGILARTQPSRKLGAPVLRIGTVACLGGAILGIAFYRAHPVEAEATAVARALSADAALRLARAAARWHPADYLPHAEAGARLVQEGQCAEAMPWLGRAMVLNPTAAEPHRYAARCLAADGKGTLAKREYRLASLLGDPGALVEAERRFASLEDLLDIAPDTPTGLTSLAALLATDRPADAEKALRRAWEEYGDLGALRGLASVTLSLGDRDAALELARLYEQRRPSDPTGYTVAARALAGLGLAEESRQELELGVARVPGSPELLATLAEQAVAARRFAEARRLVESMTSRSAAEVAWKRLFVARILWAQGRLTEAIQEARSASAAVPADPGPRVALSGYCAGAGRYDEAIATLEGAAALPGTRPGAYDAQLAKLRSARQAQAEQRTREQILEDRTRLPGRP